MQPVVLGNRPTFDYPRSIVSYIVAARYVPFWNSIPITPSGCLKLGAHLSATPRRLLRWMTKCGVQRKHLLASARSNRRSVVGVCRLSAWTQVSGSREAVHSTYHGRPPCDSGLD